MSNSETFRRCVWCDGEGVSQDEQDAGETCSDCGGTGEETSAAQRCVRDVLEAGAAVVLVGISLCARVLEWRIA